MRTINWRSCQAINSNTENEFLERVVDEHQSALGRELFSLEIGAFHGLSAAILAQFGFVISIDLWGDPYDGEAHPEAIGRLTFTLFIQNMVRLGLIDRVFPICSSSAILDVLPTMKLDIIYVDANHGVEAVRKDIERSRRHLDPSGLFIFDDYKGPGSPLGYGVNVAVDELLATGEFVIFDQFPGCIVLKRSDA